MLRQFLTESELSEALDLTSGSPYLLPIHYSIRHELHGMFPEAQCSVFGFPYNTPHLWMLIRSNKFTRPHVFMACRTQLFLTNTDIDAFLVLVLPHLIELPEFSARILGIQLSSRMSDLYSSHFDFTAPSYLSNYFLVSEPKQRLISEMTVQLAEGYQFDELDPDTDADTVAGSWKFSTPGDRDQFSAKMRRMPSVGIKTDEGELASFTVVDAAGFFNNQFTFPLHRQRGLADKSELRLCQKVIEFGMYPIKFVEHENTAVLARSARSPWWSTVVDEAGVPVIQDHRVVYRLSPPQINTYGGLVGSV